MCHVHTILKVLFTQSHQKNEEKKMRPSEKKICKKKFAKKLSAGLGNSSQANLHLLVLHLQNNMPSRVHRFQRRKKLQIALRHTFLD
jgi:hypothetical protein